MIYHVPTKMRQSLASVTEQADLSLTWLQTPEDKFSHDVAHIIGYYRHQESSKPVPVLLKQSVDHWKTVAQKSEETLTQVKVNM